ncbi:PAS domain S-box [Schinkia azotoformans MEV2011]|uniref:PAS domain S-box n=1 Tax=Schinkia azotoformans MEV2011 TaxID=1348973 RepID=A0A072NGH1_SCHAZ|nr:sigma 54-interacting transcriptional regulator [Schinkia azotoformans]KEF36591.1 PAS domain S-box [Schinkia azotoformans MEV2011]MEC1695556.1 sigma 54-interacting transcriptional regulator [Schinkia azotoformans]MEC1723951.1 sigma 54-interacting transcriptional regulator [Schinkia azotoformans]MEC1770931.1 sigma 54-interacting transcriptional regulator [Schinkia azotoformans]MEC1777882.1 sigma 54-interacting transcriptional regulator [Schinkia azotoformans]
MFWKSFETKQMLEAILGSIDEAIHAVNSEGITIFYNKVAAKHDGVEIDEVLGKHVLEVFPSLNNETSTLLKVIETGKPIYQQSQTYKNTKGVLIDTINTTLPIKVGDRIVGAIEIAKDLSRVKQLSQKLHELQERVVTQKMKPVTISGAKYHWDDFITASETMKNVKVHAKRAAGSTSPVIVYGETGTGKELLVQSIHNASPRSNGPFIAQNCASLPESLLESILFGTKKGSFTGSVDRAGLFELAHGGTLFLDEIHAMPLDFQMKLLRVLEDGVIRRVGGTESYVVDVRIIVAMNEHPLDCLEKNTLRSDLYYRLNVFFIGIVPLRERKEDISLLANHFMKKYNYQLNKLVIKIDDKVISLLEGLEWPGNVRELENTMEYAMNIVDGDTIRLEHLPPILKEPVGATSAIEEKTLLKPLRVAVEQTERKMILQALSITRGNILKASNILKIPRQTLQYKMKKHGLISEEKE